MKGFKRDDRVSEEFADRELDAFLDAKEGVRDFVTSCEGARLNPVARNVRFREQGIHAVVAQSVIDVERFVNALKLSARGEEIARDILVEVKSRLRLPLQEVGLGLSHAGPLGADAVWRWRSAFAPAAQLGSNLQGVAYVLDEPTMACMRATTASCSTR